MCVGFQGCLGGRQVRSRQSRVPRAVRLRVHWPTVRWCHGSGRARLGSRCSDRQHRPAPRRPRGPHRCGPPGTGVIASLPASAFSAGASHRAGGHVGPAVLPHPGPVLGPTGQIIGAGNPAWLMRSQPPVPIPAARLHRRPPCPGRTISGGAGTAASQVSLSRTSRSLRANASETCRNLSHCHPVSLSGTA
jgi:hypothetical protein